MENKAFGLVFNIQRFTISDGPGLRTELFLKGCPLRCRWCSNPESWMEYPEPGIYPTKCIGTDKCGRCCTSDGHEALNFNGNVISGYDRQRSSEALKCAEKCPADAIKVWGIKRSVSECMDIIRKDKGYYERSGGGVTISGGEPLLQTDFVREILSACKAEDISTCVESCLHVDHTAVEKVLPFTDIFISDIKHMDDEIHKKYTGASNKLILSNLEKLSAEDIRIILRIPLIPGINDDEKNMRETADFIKNKMNGKIEELQLLSYMRLGEEKYSSLGLDYPMGEFLVDRDSFQNKVKTIRDFFVSQGIPCRIGTNDNE